MFYNTTKVKNFTIQINDPIFIYQSKRLKFAEIINKM